MSFADSLEKALKSTKGSRKEQGRVVVLSSEESEEMNREIHDSLYGPRGAFSGTNVCECGGEVVYSVKRSDGAELGVCKKCGQMYTDPRGSRLPATDTSEPLF